jgi:hypothetical protein
MAPRATPAGSTYRPGSETDGGYLEIRPSKRYLLQRGSILIEASGFRFAEA